MVRDQTDHMLKMPNLTLRHTYIACAGRRPLCTPTHTMPYVHHLRWSAPAQPHGLRSAAWVSKPWIMPKDTNKK
jgi:hypothetical protein